MQEITKDPLVSFAAPLTRWDSYKDSPVVGSTADFVLHLAGIPKSERLFGQIDESVVGQRLHLS